VAKSSSTIGGAMLQLRVMIGVAGVATAVAATGVSAAPTAVVHRSPRLGVATPLATGRVSPLRTYLASYGQGRAALLARQLDVLVRAGVPRRAALAAAAASGDAGAVVVTADSAPSGAVLPMGSVDAHGTDVLDFRYPRVGGRVALQVLVRRAVSGRLLWSRTVPMAKGEFIFPLPTRTGPHYFAGVVLLAINLTSSGSTITESMTLVGLSGTNKVLWRHGESGSFDSQGNVNHLPVVDGFVGPTGTEPEAVLFSRLTSRSSNSGTTTTTTPLRLDAGTGALTSLGAPVQSGDGEPSVWTVSDITGDRYEDAVIANPGGAVLARDGRSGKSVWSNTALTITDGAVAESVGDVHTSPAGHPRVQDIAVGTGTPTGAGLSTLPIPVPVADPTTPAHGQVALLDGATGASVWSKTGDFPYAVLTAGAGQSPATGVLTADLSPDATGTGKATETLTLTTYDDTSAQIYTHSYSASVDGDGAPDSSDGFAIAAPVGDFEPDGSADGVALIFVSDGNNVATSQQLFHGVDGSPYPTTSAAPLGASTTGHGDDLVTVTTRHGVSVTVSRGRDLHALFTRTIPATSGISAASGYGALFNRSRCADVLVTGMGQQTDLVADLASNGQIRWYVTYSPTSSSAGAIHHPATRITATCPT